MVRKGNPISVKQRMSNFWGRISKNFFLQNLERNKLVGAGAAIIISFLALAGAALSLDLTFVVCFCLFSFLYWLFIYSSIYLNFRWNICEKTKAWLFHEMKAAFTCVKEKSSLVFFLNILVIIFFNSLILLSYLILNGQKEAFVGILLIMAQCSAIYFCFGSKNELSRFQAVFSFFLSFFLNIFIFEKLSKDMFVSLFLLFLVVKFLIIKYGGFFPLNFLFFVILIAYFFICPEISLWGFALLLTLIFLCLFHFFFRKEEESGSTPKKSLFFSLLFLLFSLFFTGNFDFADTGFHLKILFLWAGALVIHLCFLSKTGREQVITSLFYMFTNVIIGGILSDSTVIFFCISALYLILNLFIFLVLWVSSLKAGKSLISIFEEGKVRIVLAKLTFLISVLYTIHFDSSNNWIWPWLATFTSQMVAQNLFFFFFDKKEDVLFNALERKQTTFLSRLVICGVALFLFLLYPASAFLFKSIFLSST